MTWMGHKSPDTLPSRRMTASLAAVASAHFTPLAPRMPRHIKTTGVNTAVTNFLYPLPTIGPLSRACAEWVACHVAFEDPGLGCSAGDCRFVRAWRVFDGASGLHRNSGRARPDCRPLLAGSRARR